MSKKIVESIAKEMPAIIKNAVGYLKDNFDESGKKVLENTSGTIGILINLFAKPLIDKYFDKLSEKKLDNFGFNIYLKASLIQAAESLEKVNLDNSLSPELVFEILDNAIGKEISVFNKEDILLIYQPKYHPAVVFVKNNYARVLRELNATPNDIKQFLRHYNENIEGNIAKEFGNDYEEHLEKTEKFRLKENETTFLWETFRQGIIGFKETEDLKYEPTFAEWKSISDLRNKDNENIAESEVDEQEEHAKYEQGLENIEKLVEDYFNVNPKNHLGKILFIVADFGKGKSVFMKHYAAELAKTYIQTGEGYFPIYFNLRNFKHFSSEQTLGIISDYLETKYSIKIDDDYFQKKQYFFLIDSLDESGELNKSAITRVIESVKSIQGINKSLYKTNRIIITSRPFDEGLSNHLKEHEPFVIENDEGRDISYFISIYGFTKEQFNDWMFETLTRFEDLHKLKTSGFAKEIIDAVKGKNKIDIYAQLLENKTLSRSELRRPIFAYMIYQLIINNVDFLSVGKLGVYLSFLNLLTKEAKHIHDANFTINLKEEFEFRNILHATAALWMYERQRGKQGALKKADICRTLEGKDREESDNEILERFKGQGITEIQFLSHSYFGENDNVLHFQHQSFAEILLAEYYLKVFIKYALDENADPEEARVKLVLGEPTEQTVLFLKEMLLLLKETSVNDITTEVIEKRKLLFPLMASLATNKHNLLFCNNLYYSWYKQCDIKENQTEFPITSLKKWCITEREIDKIINLAKAILDSNNSYIPTQASHKTALFKNEVLVIQNQYISRLPSSIDKWLALLIGNVLYNDHLDTDNRKLFNWDYSINFSQLFEMVKGWNYTFNDSCPVWGKDLLMGIDMRRNNSSLSLDHYNFDGINFSYSYFCNVNSWSTNWARTTFHSCSFDRIGIVTSLFFETTFTNVKYINDTYISNCEIYYGFKVFDILGTSNFDTLFEADKNYNLGEISEDGADHLFNVLSGFFSYFIGRSICTINQIKEYFLFDDEIIKKSFHEKIDSLAKYEPQS